jgi:hypothetical protein
MAGITDPLTPGTNPNPSPLPTVAENVTAAGQPIAPVSQTQLQAEIDRAVISSGLTAPTELGSFEEPSVGELANRLAIVEAKLAKLLRMNYGSTDFSTIY